MLNNDNTPIYLITDEFNKIRTFKSNLSENNIQTNVRQSAPDSVFVNGLRVKSISGADSSKLKIKQRKFKN